MTSLSITCPLQVLNPSIDGMLSSLPQEGPAPFLHVTRSTQTYGLMPHPPGPLALLLVGWKHGDRDIGWAELVALELAILWLVQCEFAYCEVMVEADNTGVIGVFNKGQSHNVSRNAAICRMASSLV